MGGLAAGRDRDRGDADRRAGDAPVWGTLVCGLQKAVEENDFFRSERYYGTVSRDIQFPVEVDPDSAKASFRNGVLTVEIAEKVQAERMKKVSIETAGE